MSFRQVPTIVKGLLLSALLAIAACTDNPSAPRQTPQLRPQPELSVSELDAIMAKRPGDYEQWRIAKTVPAFGGLYIDSDGIPVVLLQDVSQLPAAQAEVRRVYQASASSPLSKPMRAEQATYNFITLATLHFRIMPVLAIPGVVMTDADERRNRVVIGVSSDEAFSAVTAAVRELGVPLEAVVVERRSKRMLASTLTDRVRPVWPGYQVVSNGGACTVGLNLETNGGPAPAYFLIPSHCTSSPGTVDGTVFYQNSLIFSDRIGAEIADSPQFTGGADCDFGDVCQRADAALVKYDNAADEELGNLPTTADRVGPFQGYGSTEVVFSTNYIYVVYGYSSNTGPIMGQEIDKMGRTSGWTYGSVDELCVNVPASGRVYLCQDGVEATAAPGDSGSPVFSGGTIYGMLGIADTTEQHFNFTPMPSIISELHLDQRNIGYCYC